MSRIDGSSALPPDEWSKSSDSETTTLRSGDTSLSDVASRLGVDEKTLSDANPQLSKISQINVGQGIQIPRDCKSGVQDEGEVAGRSGSSAGMPPIGDPLAKLDVESRLQGKNVSADDLKQVTGGGTYPHAAADVLIVKVGTDHTQRPHLKSVDYLKKVDAAIGHNIKKVDIIYDQPAAIDDGIAKLKLKPW